MLERPGDLIPVLPNATSIPWTRRRSQILNFLHRGPVTFSTLVYDTNVGDIAAISTYFNPERITVSDLNSKFGGGGGNGKPWENGTRDMSKPRLLIYPEQPKGRVGNIGEIPNQSVKAQRTLNWVLSNQDTLTPPQNQLADFSANKNNYAHLPPSPTADLNSTSTQNQDSKFWSSSVGDYDNFLNSWM